MDLLREGSSPLTRGKHPHRRATEGPRGLIPAHAGKTNRRVDQPHHPRAHPRSRGENDGGFNWRANFPGSSPLTRGKPGRGCCCRWRGGLIPAHAGKTRSFGAILQLNGAHPRSRGENGKNSHSGHPSGGSSPLTRGKQHARCIDGEAPGLIPAHAGKTRRSRPGSNPGRAHPRSRGENSSRISSKAFSPGSSPLTRGKLVRRPGERVDSGLIPAHAGKTARSLGLSLRSAAHPRSRGENSRTGCRDRSPRGSSPLTRGKHQVSGEATARGRLIPAHAGKTCLLLWGKAPAPAHPRSRGENKKKADAKKADAGSSPLTRGKPAGVTHCPSCNGLIPAHAGKTTAVRQCLPNAGAHPRSRGENYIPPTQGTYTQGSSPLTRGKQEVQACDVTQWGLIPAHAGKTVVTVPRQAGKRAHPRSRGENPSLLKAMAALRGSSPLTRGKQLVQIRGPIRTRLIPAHAGKTVMPTRFRASVRAHPRSRGENRPAA